MNLSKTLRPLDKDFELKTGKIDHSSWHKIIAPFADANIYQTCSYEKGRPRHFHIDHIILLEDCKIVSAAQLRILKVPFFETGIAYVRWGPLIQLGDKGLETEKFRQAIRALRNEYVYRRGFHLIIAPMLYDEFNEDASSILVDEGYERESRIAPERTLLVNISAPLSEIRMGLHQKWRNCLNQAEKRQLEIIEGESTSLFEVFIGVYREMLRRKSLEEPQHIRRFPIIQKDLPSDLKMRIFLCRSKDGIGAGAICSAIGNTGLYMFGATNSMGLANKGSYLIQWRIIEWLKERGCSWYDLNGINPKTNPGTYHFKAGIAGSKGRNVNFIGRYAAFSSPIGRIFFYGAKSLLRFYRKIGKHLQLTG